MRQHLPRFTPFFAAGLLLVVLFPLAVLPAAAESNTSRPVSKKYYLDLISSGPGQSTGSGAYLEGSIATLDPHPDAGAIFVGWTIDGTFAGWASPFQLTVNGTYQVVAYFVPYPVFPDVQPNNLGRDVIGELAARGIIKGYQDGRFGPADPILRAQMAALIARAIPGNPQSGPGVGPQTWALEDHNNPFPDQGAVDADLWRNVGTLAYYNVAKGYANGSYDPTGLVLKAQAISFITRAMVAKGYWTQETVDDPTLYPNIPATSGHRLDIVTYLKHTSAISGTTPGANWDDWEQPATRAWFASVLWQALDTIYRPGFTRMGQQGQGGRMIG